ncbi:PAS domain-containing sensor histidine kinase [Elstera litoralis]|uniref:PAS domain-containing sensor histidine kinase n=1 Tax=Elstera litoralis TaxID=552518 RepID=UPI0006972C7F|nr:PAS domain-containing sensor histidine kinase [Elstera litoralis]
MATPIPPPNAASALPAASDDQQELFTALLDGSNQAILIHDRLEPLYANRRFARLLGFESPEEVIALGWLDDLIPIQRLVRAFVIWSRVLESGQAVSLTEVRGFSRQGVEFYVDIHTRPIQWQGRTVIFSSLYDVTARARVKRELEGNYLRYRQLAESAHDVFWDMSADGRLTQVEGGDDLGHAFSLCLGDRWIDHIPLEARDDATVTAIEAALAAGRAFRSETIPFDLGPLGRRLIEMNGVPVRDEAERLIGFRGTFRDETGAEQARREGELQRNLAALGRVSGGVAHEINNLLQPILTYSRLAADRATNNRDREAMQTILASARQARDIVRTVLEFARPRSLGGLATIPDPIEVIDREIRILAAQAPEIRLTVSHTPDSNRAIFGGPGELGQVVANLLKNAFEAMDGPGTVTVTTAAHADGKALELCIADTGPGMTETVRARVFEPFFTTKEFGKGTGLGLSIVYGVVRRWGGTIQCVSFPGSGTRFTLILPYVTALSPPEGEKPPA